MWKSDNQWTRKNIFPEKYHKSVLFMAPPVAGAIRLFAIRIVDEILKYKLKLTHHREKNAARLQHLEGLNCHVKSYIYYIMCYGEV